MIRTIPALLMTRHPTKRSSCRTEFVWFAVPGEVLVVEGVASQAAVEDTDEPVRGGSEGLVVGGSAGALSVIECAGGWGIVECGECLQEQCVAEAAVRLMAEARKEDRELSLNAAVVRVGTRVG